MPTKGAEAPYLSEWFVAFGDWGTNLAWHRLCRRGFRHVLAFGYEPRANVWLVVDAAFEATLIRVLPDPSGLVDALWAVDARILRCRVEGKGQRRPRVFATCVTMIGHLIGLPSCAVFPHGLYRMLIRRGAVPAFERHGNDQPRFNGAGHQPAG